MHKKSVGYIVDQIRKLILKGFLLRIGDQYRILLTLRTPTERRRTKKEKRKVGVHAMKRVAAGAHLPTPWLFDSAKRPYDRADFIAWIRVGSKNGENHYVQS